MKKSNGITLIALIITIIVLLILAGVTISMVLGDNGILNKAFQAKEKTEIADEKEIVGISAVQAVLKSDYGNIEKENLEEALAETTDRITEVDKEGEKYIVTFYDTKRSYEVDGTGEAKEYTVYKDPNPGELSGSGTNDDPFRIESIEDLVTFSIMVNGGNTSLGINADNFSEKYVSLERNLDFESKFSYDDYETTFFGDFNLDGITESLKTELTKKDENCIGFKPIGSSTSDFKGKFEGNNYIIYNIYEVYDTEAGLFGVVSNATISNLTITGSITSTTKNAAGICGVVNGTSIVDNCINKANINATNESPTSGYDGGTIYKDSFSGGVCGSISINSTVSNCINYGNVITAKTYAAGIVACCLGKITNCANYGNISGYDVAAGIGAYHYCGESEIVNCFNYGNINSINVSGGIWGKQMGIGSSSVCNCFNYGNVTATTMASGIYGGGRPSPVKTIINCCNFGNVTAGTANGVYGMLLSPDSNLTMSNAYFLDNVEKGSNSPSAIATQFSSEELQVVVETLNNYISENIDATTEWKQWKIGGDGYITFE